MSRRCPRAWLPLFATALAVALTALPALVPMPLRLLWNVSASVPLGLYAVKSIDAPALGELVVIEPSERLAALLIERGYLGRNAPLIKRVEALEGQTVCRFGGRILVDGTVRAVARRHDGFGRELPVWSGCRVLEETEVLLLNAGEPASFDGRYFGPLQRRFIFGRAVPIWTDDAQ